MKTVPDLNNLITKYIGTPYKERGSDIGMDCYEITRALYNEGLDLDMSNYAPDNTQKFFEYYCKEYGWEFPWEKLQQWDMLLLHTVLYPVDHCGIVLNTTEFVHCIQPTGVCIGKIKKYKRHIYQIVRPRIFGEEYDDQARELIENARSIMLRKATIEKENFWRYRTIYEDSLNE
jgi:cell wall-associated NlpC family hydrolase